MDISLVLKVSGIGILVSVVCQILSKSGRDDQAMFVSIAGIIIVLMLLINLGILFILSYYGVSFSILLFKYFFKNKDYNRIVIVKRYFKVLIISLVFIILNLIIDSYLIPRILLLF